jgi:DNA-binding transcriptional LysR family regulator
MVYDGAPTFWSPIAMELRHLRYFIAVAELRSVRSASEQLHVTQPAISRQIEATAATVRAGLAITAWLASTVPADLETLTPRASSLPALPPFAICLRLPATDQPAAQEFARHVRESMSSDAGGTRARLAKIA